MKKNPLAGLSIAPPSCTETLREDITKGANGIALLVFYSASMVFIVTTNSLFILGLYRTYTKRLTSAQRMFFILSCSDLLAGLVYIPIQIYSIVKVPDITCTMTGTRTFWSVFPIVFSGMTIMFLTIDRYWIIARQKSKKNENRRLSIYILLTFPVSFGWAIWYTMATQATPSEATNRKTAIFFICLATFELCVLIVVLIFNVHILRSVQIKTKNSSLKFSKKKTSEQRLSRTIIIISSTLVICYLPSVIGLYVIGAFFHDLTLKDILFTKPDEILTYNKALIWSLVPTLINSGLNAAIFIARNTRIKKMYKSVYNRNIQWMEDENSGSGSSEEQGGDTPGPSPVHTIFNKQSSLRPTTSGTNLTVLSNENCS